MARDRTSCVHATALEQLVCVGKLLEGGGEGNGAKVQNARRGFIAAGGRHARRQRMLKIECVCLPIRKPWLLQAALSAVVLVL